MCFYLISIIVLLSKQVALEELANRVNGDMRMAINQLQYMGLQMSVIKYDDVIERLKSSAKDEDISPFTAVDKYFNLTFLSLHRTCLTSGMKLFYIAFMCASYLSSGCLALMVASSGWMKGLIIA